MLKTVKAVKPHTGKGKHRNVGDKYTLDRRSADIMQRIGKVEIVGESVAVHVTPHTPKAVAEAEKEKAETLEPDALSEAREAYAAHFGKAPHHKMKAESIMEAIAADKGE